MLDILVLAVLTLVFLFMLYRWREGRQGGPAPLIGSGALLVGFVLWWYLLGPLVNG